VEGEKDCGLLGEKCWVGNWAGNVLGDGIESLARAISEALGQIVVSLSTFWVNLPTSNLTSNGVNPSPTVSFLQSGLWYWTAALAVLAVIIGGARMAWEQRGDPIKDLVRSLLTLTLVSGMGLAVIAFLITAADGFSTWIIDESTNGKGFASAIQNMIITGQADTAVFMVIIMGLLGIVTSIVQIVLMVIRSGMLVILAGILPTTAAFTNTEMGKQWFQKAIGWTLAFILYKPAAAIVYAAAFRLIDGGGLASSALLNSITGLALMVVALLALPALLRFVAPMVGAVASGGGGGGAAAMGAAAAAAMPSGARSLGSAGRSRGSMSPTPSSSSGEGSSSKSSSPSGSSPTSSGGGAALAARSTGGSKGIGAVVGSDSVSSGSSPGRVAAGGGAASGAAAGAKAGAVAGPVGAAAGAAVSVAAKGQEAVKQVSNEAAGDGPSGNNN
jgi:type IV secretion system protein TrbL